MVTMLPTLLLLLLHMVHHLQKQLKKLMVRLFPFHNNLHKIPAEPRPLMGEVMKQEILIYQEVSGEMLFLFLVSLGHFLRGVDGGVLVYF